MVREIAPPDPFVTEQFVKVTRVRAKYEDEELRFSSKTAPLPDLRVMELKEVWPYQRRMYF